MMRTLLATMIAAAFTLPAAAAPPDVLSQLISAPQASAYHGEQIIATWDGTQTQTTLVGIEHDPPGWTRLEYAPVGSAARRVVLRHDRTEIQYDPATLRGTQRSRLPEIDDDVEAAHVAWLSSNYQIRVTPARMLARPVRRVDLQPRAADRPSRRLYVDLATGIVLRSERAAPDGRVGEITSFVGFEPMPRGWRRGATPRENLQLSLERGPRAVTEEEAARLAAQKPVAFAAPPGFHPLGLYVIRDRPSVFQRVYSDGLSTLVLTQRPGGMAHAPEASRRVDTGGGPVWIHALGLRTLAQWSSSGWVLTLVGDVTVDTMVAAARETGVSPRARLIDRLLHWLRRGR